MLKIIRNSIPDSFKNRFLLLFTAFVIVAGLSNISAQYLFDKFEYSKLSNETIRNIHFSSMNSLRDSILYDDIYTLFTITESIAHNVSLVQNVFILNSKKRYITDAMVTKDIPAIQNDSSSYKTMDITLDNGKTIGYAVYHVDLDYIQHQILSHNIVTTGVIMLIIVVFLVAAIVLIFFFTKPINIISASLIESESSSVPIYFNIPEHTSSEIKTLANIITALSVELDKKMKQNIESEKKIAQDEKLAAIGSLSAGLAHELRNPAMSLKIMTHSFRTGESITDDDLVVIEREVDRISMTVNEFLRIAKTVDVDITETNTKRIKRMLIEHFHRVLNEISILYYGNDFEFKTDELKLFSVLENLIYNSKEADATSVKIHFEQAPNSTIISYIDNGVGIQKNIADKVFLPFFTTKKSGTGLGMSMCEKILFALNGTISIDTSYTEGAKFTIILKGANNA
ncbi:sensor histidine kinase [Limisalsivibrio acetivorans]|uniref:sensor histidine kinase n=1 Tax=Limisalsivibrio acetivorans TaxID=1304888 RepID=UPI0003B34B47|nr:HAMP domain-containing sensor histidine kinase [Limisalsivibrio acetivorans]